MERRIESKMVCGYDFYVNTYAYALCISSEGQVHSFGFHEKGAHGHKKAKVVSPKQILSLKNITSIACGDDHTLCLDINGDVFSFGKNMCGQLGLRKDNQTLEYCHEPQLIDISPIKQVCCGHHFSMCVSRDGFVFSFGYNLNGELGHNNTRQYNYPEKIDGVEDVDFIECGGHFTLCKIMNGDFYGWGSNTYGQLGFESKYQTPMKCLNWPDDVVDIKCGFNHTLVLTSNQNVLSTGFNYSGQLGRKTNDVYSFGLKKIDGISEIIRIECGANHSICLDINNNLFVFGDNRYGQLGLGDQDDKKQPIQHPSLSNIIDISTGGHSTFVKTSNNEIYAFGSNNYSQLGIITKDRKQLKPIRVFEDNEDIWFSNINKSKAKSARSILPRPKIEDYNSPPKKKQK